MTDRGVQIQQSRLGLGSRILYRGIRGVLMAFFAAWFRLSVRGKANIPSTGGFILAPGGHRSILDTGVVAATSTRLLRYMGAEKYFAAPGLGWFLRLVGGFPIDRNATDREALRLSEQVLRGGEPLVVFPEGTRFSGPVVQPFQAGAAFLACRAQVPVVPVGMGGTERAWPPGSKLIRPKKVALVVGKPLVPPVAQNGGRVKRSAVRAFNDEIHAKVQQLFDEAQELAGAT